MIDFGIFYKFKKHISVKKINEGMCPGVEFKQKFQLASRTSRYKNQLVPQIFY
jgi:hypothetical protein